MNWYYFLAYFIFKYYRGKDNLPVFFSFLSITALFCVNLQSAAGIIHFFIPFLPNNSKYYAILLLGIIGLTNYFILYKNRYYEIVFASFDKEPNIYNKWKFSVRLYIIISIAFLIVMLILMDLKNHGKI